MGLTGQTIWGTGNQGVKLGVAPLTVTNLMTLIKILLLGGGPVVKNLPLHEGNMGSIPGPQRFHIP